jgi:hypothetical protein
MSHITCDDPHVTTVCDIALPPIPSQPPPLPPSPPSPHHHTTTALPPPQPQATIIVTTTTVSSSTARVSGVNFGGRRDAHMNDLVQVAQIMHPEEEEVELVLFLVRREQKQRNLSQKSRRMRRRVLRITHGFPVRTGAVMKHGISLLAGIFQVIC